MRRGEAGVSCMWLREQERYGKKESWRKNVDTVLLPYLPRKFVSYYRVMVLQVVVVAAAAAAADGSASSEA